MRFIPLLSCSAASLPSWEPDFLKLLASGVETFIMMVCERLDPPVELPTPTVASERAGVCMVLSESRKLVPQCLTALALITNSPFESRAAMESLVPVPGPLTYPPVAKPVPPKPLKIALVTLAAASWATAFRIEGYAS